MGEEKYRKNITRYGKKHCGKVVILKGEKILMDSRKKYSGLEGKWWKFLSVVMKSLAKRQLEIPKKKVKMDV